MLNTSWSKKVRDAARATRPGARPLKRKARLRFARAALPGDVLQRQRLHEAGVAGFRPETLNAAGKSEAKSRTPLWRHRGRQARQTVARMNKRLRLDHCIGDRLAAGGRGDIHPVSDRAAPVRPGVDRRQTVLDAEQAANVPSVAVGVPASGVDDRHRLLETVARRRAWP